MKNKLIAILVASTLVGGGGVTAFASENNGDNAQSTYCQKSNKNTCGYGVFSSNCNYNSLQNSIQQFLSRCGLLNANNCKNSIVRFNNVTPQSLNFKEQVVIKETASKTENTDSKQEVVQVKQQNTDSKQEVVQVKQQNTVSKQETVQAKQENTVQKESVAKQETNINDKFMIQVESKIFEKVNQERRKAGLPALARNSTMDKYARIKSQDMGDKNYFSHTDLQGNYITSKMEQDGVKYSSWAENIAYIGGTYDSNALADQFMRNWMNSSGHRANILSNNYSSIGIGVYKAGNRVYATQEFHR